MEDRLKTIFNKMFKGKVEYSINIKREEVPKWDSMTHVKLCVAIENEFGIRFNGSEVTEMNTGFKILQVINEKIIKK